MARKKKADVFPAKTREPAGKTVETITHSADTRRNIPTAELQAVVAETHGMPVRVAYERRNRDLDPQLVWRGKDDQDWSDLVVPAPPLYIQEKVHPKALIDDLLKQSAAASAGDGSPRQQNLFDVFDRLPEGADKTDFYRHEQNWSNRMILGDSLQVMASLAEREGLRGQVQCIYFDPPYGIKFNSNFQWSTTSRDVKDGKSDHITREPEQVKAFRDTWRDGIHSYLTYLRDRLTVARDLLTESGSIFVQIGDENVHRVRAVMDEVFGDENYLAHITFTKTSGTTSDTISAVADTLLWYGKNKLQSKTRKLFAITTPGGEGAKEYKRVELISGEIVPLGSLARGLPNGARILSTDSIVSQGGDDEDIEFPSSKGPIRLSCKPNRHWKPGANGIRRLWKVDRLLRQSGLRIYKRYFDDFPCRAVSNIWVDTRGEDSLDYVVQTSAKVIERCLLMATDPGDLVLDPTCGSGTTAYVAEQWGRRWITIDTSRVALALARARIMGARYPYYLLADSREGQKKEAEATRSAPSTQPVHGNVRLGFVYERVPHITLKSIANNAEIDVIHEKWQATLEPLRGALNKALKHAENKAWEEWEIPREPEAGWPAAARTAHADWWEARIARQKEIDASIAAKAEFEYLYDKPYEDRKKVRVAGPFTVESLSPHRSLGIDAEDRLTDARAGRADSGHEVTGLRGAVGHEVTGLRGAGDGGDDFVRAILDNLKTAGVQQAHKADRLVFSSLAPWPGSFICAEGRYADDAKGASGRERRAAIFIGPEYGTVSRNDLSAAAREALEAGFDLLVACGFNFEAVATEFSRLGPLPILKARMNADLHMADDLKNTGKGNLFVVFGEPDIELVDAEPEHGNAMLQVKIRGVDVFHPTTGEVRSDNADGIACWFIDTDYDEQSFFVRHAYFLGAGDPYAALKTTLKAEIDPEAWESLRSDTSRPFARPAGGRIAVKAINHLGDEVMKVFRV